MIALFKRLLAVAMVLTGLMMIIFGRNWSEGVFNVLAGSGAWLEHFVPFVPIAFIGLGAALYDARPGTGKPG